MASAFEFLSERSRVALGVRDLLSERFSRRLLGERDLVSERPLRSFRERERLSERSVRSFRDRERLSERSLGGFKPLSLSEPEPFSASLSDSETCGGSAKVGS